MGKEKKGPTPASALASLKDHVAVVLWAQGLSEALELFSKVLSVHLSEHTHLIEGHGSSGWDPLHVKLFFLLLDALHQANLDFFSHVKSLEAWVLNDVCDFVFTSHGGPPMHVLDLYVVELDSHIAVAPFQLAAFLRLFHIAKTRDPFQNYVDKLNI